MGMELEMKDDLPSFLFSMMMFRITPLSGEYQLLAENTFTFLNSDGFEFLIENTFFLSILME